MKITTVTVLASALFAANISAMTPAQHMSVALNAVTAGHIHLVKQAAWNLRGERQRAALAQFFEDDSNINPDIKDFLKTLQPKTTVAK